MAKIVAVFIILAVMTRLSTQQEKQKFCGRRLANALSLLCVNGLMLEKRGGHELLGDGELTLNYWPWAMDVRAMERVSRGRRKSIIEECCDNPCSIDQLMDYCKPADM